MAYCYSSGDLQHKSISSGMSQWCKGNIEVILFPFLHNDGAEDLGYFWQKRVRLFFSKLLLFQICF